MLQSDGFLGKEGKATMGGYSAQIVLNPVLLPPVLV